MVSSNSWLTLSLFFCLFNFTLGNPTPGHYSKLLKRAEDVQDEYDYVVVGGGTAGLTVADRLTENSNYTVLVIEHGSFDNGSSVYNISGGLNGIYNFTHLFAFPSVPQTELNDRVAYIILGDLLGGSSAVNGFGVLRGSQENYNQWAALFGGFSTWNWAGLLPYFKKAWTLTPPDEEIIEDFGETYDSSYWGNQSHIYGTFASFEYPFLKVEMEAWKDIPGVPFPKDSGAGEPGVLWYPDSVDPRTQTRSHARAGHWDWIFRDNYETITESKVINILLQGNTATGVQFVPRDATDTTIIQTVKARKEVILAAGAIHTPQILQTSGIGPRGVLEAANITVKVELPGVGANFQDHPTGAIGGFTFDNFTFSPVPEDLKYNDTFIAWADEVWATNKTGPRSIATAYSAALLPLPIISTNFEEIASSYEAQDPSAYLPNGTHPTIIAGYAVQKALNAAVMRSNNSAVYNFMLRGDYAENQGTYLHPLSRGNVNINTTDPVFSYPIVDYRSMSNPTDLDVMVEIVKFTRQYMNTPTFAPYLPRETEPGSNVTTNDGIKDYVKSTVSPTTFHPIGTTAMMPLELGGVVDVNLLVYGTQHLSVIDAGIIPMLPGAYTQQTVYAIAEKAADIIKSRQWLP